MATVSAEPSPKAPSPSRPAPKPFEHEGDTEYQNGLASQLIAAPLLGVEMVTSLYQWGYLTGLHEAKMFQIALRAKIRENGCLAGGLFATEATGRHTHPAIMTNNGPQPIEEFCATARVSDSEGYGPQGKLFSKVRLDVAQGAAKYVQDPRELNIRVGIYVIGYNMGFAHQWDLVDFQSQVEKDTRESCVTGLAVVPPASPAQASVITAKCEAEAQTQRNADSTLTMKCLMASPDMSGELSGHAIKAGCPRGK